MGTSPQPSPPTDDVASVPSHNGDSTTTLPATTLPVIIAAAFDRLALRQRARMLGRLLASVGPLALAVVGGGAFAKYATHARWPELPVSLEDAARATSAQVQEIVRYIEQSDPQLFNNLLDILARDSATIAAMGASIAALTALRLSARRPTAAGSPARRAKPAR